jgi:hypothetical protein
VFDFPAAESTSESDDDGNKVAEMDHVDVPEDDQSDSSRGGDAQDDAFHGLVPSNVALSDAAMFKHFEGTFNLHSPCHITS